MAGEGALAWLLCDSRALRNAGARFAAQFYASNATEMQEASIDGRAMWRVPLSSGRVPGKVRGVAPFTAIQAVVYTYAGHLYAMSQDGIPFAAVSLGDGVEVLGVPAVVGAMVYVLVTHAANATRDCADCTDAAAPQCSLVAVRGRNAMVGKLQVMWSLPYACSGGASGAAMGSSSAYDGVPIIAVNATGTSAGGTVLVFPNAVALGGKATASSGDATTEPGLVAVALGMPDMAAGAMPGRILWTSTAPAGTTPRTLTLAGLGSTVGAPSCGSGGAGASAVGNYSLWVTYTGPAGSWLVRTDLFTGLALQEADVASILGVEGAAVTSAQVLSAPCSAGGGSLVMAVAASATGHTAGPSARGQRRATAVQLPAVVALDGAARHVQWSFPLASLPQRHAGAQGSPYVGTFALLTPLVTNGTTLVLVSDEMAVTALGTTSTQAGAWRASR